MLGHRGCRLAITFPEIYQMQVRAVAEAFCDVMEAEAEAEATAEVTAKAVAEVTAKATEMAQEARVEIMIPLVGSHKELKLLRRWCEEEIEKVQRERGEFFSLSYWNHD